MKLTRRQLRRLIETSLVNEDAIGTHRGGTVLSALKKLRNIAKGVPIGINIDDLLEDLTIPPEEYPDWLNNLIEEYEKQNQSPSKKSSNWQNYIDKSKDKKTAKKISIEWYYVAKKLKLNQGFGGFVKWYNNLIKTGDLGAPHNVFTDGKIKNKVPHKGPAGPKDWKKGDHINPQSILLLLQGIRKGHK